MIKISPTNPIRFKNSLPYDFIHDDFDEYCQKFTTSDKTSVQVISDEENPPVLTLRSSPDGLEVATYTLNAAAENITIDEGFKVYEIEILFSAIGEGYYYFEFNSEQYSNVIHVKDHHEDTVLIKYRNSYNNFGVIFDTGIVFHLRVEGEIRDYEPRSNNEIYNDQLMNAAKLYSLPYNIFTFYVGQHNGLPDFMLDMVNRAFSCDMIKIDDDWFEKTDGAEWQVFRTPEYDLSGMSITVMPAINNIAEQIRIDEGEDLEPTETMIIQRYSNNYQDATGSLTVNNVFEKNSVLNYIRVFRKAEAYTIRVGTTPGGNEIVECEIQNILHTINLNHAFNEPQPLYISGMVGANDISLVWDKVDRFFNPGGTGGDPTPQPAQTLGVGATIEWHGTQVELEEQFNLVTGLGRDTGDWVGWAICNGENGTPEAGGKTSIAWKAQDPDYGTIGATGGSKQVSLSQNNLPKFRVRLFSNETRAAQVSSDIVNNAAVAKGTTTSGKKDEKYSMLRSNQEPTLGWSSEVGGDQPFSIVQPYIVLVKIKKIF